MNRTHIKWLPIVAALLFMLFRYLTSETYVNPETGRKAHVGMSTQQEMALGLQSYQQVLSQSQTVDSGPEVELVHRVVNRLTPATRDAGKDFDWQVSVVQSDQVNAFCLPGGKIVVYTGILPVANTEAFLATVLGHEMAHATSRHGAQRVFQSNLTQAAMVGVAGSISDMDPGKQQEVMAALGAGAQYGMILPFSRKDESEADHIGLIYMARAGYDPRESIKFWQRMEASSKGQPPQLLSDHPSHGTRIQQLEAWMPGALEEYNRAAQH